MASNKFFTILVVPEKTQKVRRLVIPHYIFNGAVLAAVFLGVLAVVMLLDYANVMNQISENKKLRVENRQLRQSIQVFKNKMVTMESTVDRVKTFVTKLRIITNIESAAPLATPSIPTPQLPDAPALPPSPATESRAVPPVPLVPSNNGTSMKDTDEEDSGQDMQLNPFQQSPEKSNRRVLLAALATPTPEFPITLSDADTEAFVRSEFDKLDSAHDAVFRYAMEQEHSSQDLLEKLGEKKAILAGTPTTLPTNGYITSEYGVRESPYDGRRKMHEGIDIANRFGADIKAPADGTITFSGQKPGYGKIVVIDHGNGIESRYAHNSKSYVTEGQFVHRGQKIAAVGSSGHSTGPHVHYEIHVRDLPVDPCYYILDHPGLCQQ